MPHTYPHLMPHYRDLRKVGGSLGSHPGGIYESSSSERFYLKRYDTASQTRVEHLANLLYRKLAIPVPDSYVLCDEEDKVQFLATRWIEGAEDVSFADIRHSEDICNGFIADALIANYDVLGYAADNIVRGADGHMYRVDNGGSMHYRARGSQKPFPADTVTELETMRDPSVIPMSDPSVAQSTAGRIYYDLSYDEQRAQALQLADVLDERQIADHVERVAFEPRLARTITQTLVGRRAYILHRFSIDD